MKRITYEAYQRHADLIIHDLGIKEDSKSVVTPGIRSTPEEHNDWDVLIDP